MKGIEVIVILLIWFVGSTIAICILLQKLKSSDEAIVMAQKELSYANSQNRIYRETIMNYEKPTEPSTYIIETKTNQIADLMAEARISPEHSQYVKKEEMIDFLAKSIKDQIITEGFYEYIEETSIPSMDKLYMMRVKVVK